VWETPKGIEKFGKIDKHVDATIKKRIDLDYKTR
jgi:hypothetical protein